MRVARFCCWLDCDSSLAGASLVILVCSDGSDLSQRKEESEKALTSDGLVSVDI